MSDEDEIYIKIVALDEIYNFDVKKYFRLTPYAKDIVCLMRQALVCGNYASKILYYFFEHLNVLK